ncbi:MAG: tryptophan--tRNA ligase [Acidobacteriaceae bacterium]
MTQDPNHPSARKRVLSGMRPTGKLHLGNYMGALKNWLQLQREQQKYECYFFIADWHALTTDYADTSQVRANTLEVALDWLGAGLDPEQSVLFVQSHVPQHAELHLLLSMITPLGWLERVPTYKEQQENLREKDLGTYGFLGYPLLMAADVLVYQADFVPVGQDQIAHVELTREVARRFNQFYAANPISQASVELSHSVTSGKSEYCVLPEPAVLLTPSPKLPGTDGRKMSKSYGNTVELTDPAPVIRQKLKTMVTDPARIRRTDKGNPDVCPVFDLHKVFSTKETQQKVREGCTTASIGCIECKGWLADAVVREIAPLQERRAGFAAKPGNVWEILDAGSAKAQQRAEETMQQVRTAMRMERVAQ